MEARQSVEYENVDKGYFEQRQLKRGAAGWILLVGLGIAYVISGDYAGWNFGLEQGGWGGLMVASLLMALMYTCMCFALGGAGDHRADRRRRLRLRPTRVRSLGRLPHGHRDPHRVCHRAGGHRRVHRRLHEVAVRNRHLAVGDLGFVLRCFPRHPHLRRRRSTAPHLRHHRARRDRVGRVDFRHGAVLRQREVVRHRGQSGSGRRVAVPALRLFRNMGGDSVRHVVLPGHRGRSAGGRGDQRSQARSAAWPHRRHVRAARLLRADHDLRPWRRRLGSAEDQHQSRWWQRSSIPRPTAGRRGSPSS